MLEKNNFFLCDSHLHYTLTNNFLLKIPQNFSYKACSVCHSKTEWENQIKINQSDNFILLNAYAIHPQFCTKNNQAKIQKELDFLEQLLKKNHSDYTLNAIGELGFDLYTTQLKQNQKLQEEVFFSQMELAIKYNMPIIIHSRKANHLIFQNLSLLKKVPSILFHSFMGPSKEALSLLNKNLNAYFSFGKQTLNNNKKVIDCIKLLPKENLLPETDAPFCTLKYEETTLISDIKKVYKAFLQIKNVEENELYIQFQENFKNMYGM